MDHRQPEEKIQSGEETYHIRYVIIGDQAGGEAEDKQEGTTAAHQPLDAPEHQRQENDAVQPKNILLIDEDEAHQGVGAGKEQVPEPARSARERNSAQVSPALPTLRRVSRRMPAGRWTVEKGSSTRLKGLSR